MKFHVLSRITGCIKFTADIDCMENDARSVKLGLAVKWGIKNGADLRMADLSGANLSGANLRWANLRWADLREADLREADLSEANLRLANLSGANLSGANLSGANLRMATGDNRVIRTVQSGRYVIVIASGVMAIGCEQHTIKEWMAFDDERIASMDVGALEWWKKWKPILKAIMEENNELSEALKDERERCAIRVVGFTKQSPIGRKGFRRRLKIAWKVFTGKYDALAWSGNQ